MCLSGLVRAASLYPHSRASPTLPNLRCVRTFRMPIRLRDRWIAPCYQSSRPSTEPAAAAGTATATQRKAMDVYWSKTSSDFGQCGLIRTQSRKAASRSLCRSEPVRASRTKRASRPVQRQGVAGSHPVSPTDLFCFRPVEIMTMRTPRLEPSWRRLGLTLSGSPDRLFCGLTWLAGV
jgi:hypothetical protein